MKREIWLDFLRVTACFLVMMVHSTEPFYLGGLGTQVLTSQDAIWVSIFEGLARCCVPVFIIVSSYLQFPLHYTIGEFIRRRTLRVLVPMAIWTLVYALAYGHPVANLKGLLLNFNYAAGHLWFVYMLLGLYVVMPLLSPWAETVSRKELKIYLGIWAFTLLIPFIREAAGGLAPILYAPDGLPAPALFPLWGEASWNPFGLFYYVSGFVGYLLLGLYIKRFVPVDRTTALTGGIIFLSGFIWACFGFMTHICESGYFPVEGSLELAVSWEVAISFCSLPVALTALGLVLLFRGIPDSGNTWFYQTVILPFATAGYGMYLLHMLILNPVSSFVRARMGVGSAGLLGPVWTTPVEILLTALLSFIAAGLVAVTLRRIPKVGKWIVG